MRRNNDHHTDRHVLGPVRAALAAVAALTLLAACGSGGDTSDAPAQEGLTTVNLAIQPNADIGAVWVGDQAGIFEKHGFALEFAPVATGGSSAVAQLLNGQVDVAAGSIGGIIAAVSQGVPVQAITGYSVDYNKNGQTGHSLIVPAGGSITSPKDLKGKTVGVNTLKSNWEIELKESIAKDGGDPNDVKVVAVPFADQPTALEQGRVDAIIAVQPFASQLSSKGFTSLGDPMTIALDNPAGTSGYMFAAKKYLADNPKFLAKWQAAIEESSQYANDNQDVARKTIAEKTGVPIEVLQKSPIPVFSGRIDPKIVQTWSELHKKYGVVDSAPSADDIIATH